MDENFSMEFLEFASRMMEKEEFQAQKASETMQESEEQCRELTAAIMKKLEQNDEDLVLRLDEEKNRQGAMEADIARFYAMRFCVRLLKFLELI